MEDEIGEGNPSAVIGVLGIVSNNLDKHLRQISSTITMETIQKSVLLKQPESLGGYSQVTCCSLTQVKMYHKYCF